MKCVSEMALRTIYCAVKKGYISCKRCCLATAKTTTIIIAACRVVQHGLLNDSFGYWHRPPYNFAENGHWEELHYRPLNSATTVWLSHLRLYHPILWIVWIFVQHLLIEMEAIVMICERPNSLFLSYPNSFLSPDTHSFFPFGYWLVCPFRYSIPVTPDPFLYSIDAIKQLDCLKQRPWWQSTRSYVCTVTSQLGGAPWLIHVVLDNAYYRDSLVETLYCNCGSTGAYHHYITSADMFSKHTTSSISTRAVRSQCTIFNPKRRRRKDTRTGSRSFGTYQMGKPCIYWIPSVVSWHGLWCCKLSHSFVWVHC